MLFDFLGIIKPTSFTKKLSGSSQRRSDLNWSQDRQPGHSFLGWKCFPLIFLHSVFANFYSVTTALKMSPVLMLFK